MMTTTIEQDGRTFTVDNGEAFTTTFAALAEANAEDLNWRNEDGTPAEMALAVLALAVGETVDLGAPGSPGGSFIVTRQS